MIGPRLDEFFAPLNPPALAVAVILGLSLGFVLAISHHKLTRAAVFWQIAGGLVFFVPLAILRAFQGSNAWERFLATTVLWACFVFGLWLGARYRT